VIRQVILGIAASLALAACSTTGSFTSDYDDQQDFSTYKTFTWAGANPMTVYGGATIPPGADAVISDAIRSELEAKGFTYVADEAKADMAIGFTVGTRIEQDVNTTRVPNYYYTTTRGGWRWGRRYYPVNTVAVSGSRELTEVSTYTEGTLAIDIFDVSRKAPVFHGAGKKTLSQSSWRGTSARPNPLELQQEVRDAITKILEDFPPE